MGRPLRWTLGALLAAALALAFVERVFLMRLATYPLERPTTSVDWYRPLEPVAGVEPERPPPTTPAAAGLDPAVLEEVARWAGERESVALLVARRGEVVLERYWRGWDAERPTNSWSMAKTVLGLLVGISLERGELPSLAAPIERWLPEWRGQPRGSITVGHLLRMQSGLVYDYDRGDPFCDMSRVHLAADLMPTLLALTPEVPAGTRFRYDNLDSQLLGVVLERATGRRYAELLGERLWSPLGAAPAEVWLDSPGGRAKTYCCIFATARDWWRVGELMRAGGVAGGNRVVPATWVEAMLTPTELQPTYGYHVWLHAGGGGPAFFRLDGKSKQRVYVVPEKELVVVRLGENASDWSETYLPWTLASAASP